MKVLKCRVSLILILALCVALMAGCAQNAEKKARDVTQRYFDAVKEGDIEGAIGCFTPAVQQSIQSMNTLGGLLGNVFFGVDASSLTNGFIGYATKNEYQNYDFKATDVVMDDDEHATVTVEVYIDGELNSKTEVKTVKYQDEWYIKE